MFIYDLFFFLREEKQYIKIPFNIEEAKNLGKVLEHYKDTYYTQVIMSISFSYILYPLSIFKFNNLLTRNQINCLVVMFKILPK